MGERGGDGGMLGDLNPLGDGPCRSLAGHGTRVPEVLPAAELEGFLAGLIVAMVLTFCINSTRGRGGHESPRWIRAHMPPEPVDGAAVGDDVEEAQEQTETFITELGEGRKRQ